jgi:hypothetical protein
MTYVPDASVKTVPPLPAEATISAGILLNTCVSIVNAVPGGTELFGA